MQQDRIEDESGQVLQMTMPLVLRGFSRHSGQNQSNRMGCWQKILSDKTLSRRKRDIHVTIVNKGSYAVDIKYYVGICCRIDE